MPRVHWDDNSNEVHLISDEGYGTGSQDSFKNPSVKLCLAAAGKLGWLKRLVYL